MVARCPHCGQLSRVGGAGNYRCPSCREVFAADDTNLTPDAPPAPPPIEPTLVYDDEPASRPDQEAGKPPDLSACQPPSPSGAAPPSPVCCERCGIYQATVICRDCGRMICPACARPAEGGASICNAHAAEMTPPTPEPGYVPLLLALISHPVEAFSRMSPDSRGVGRAIVFNLTFGLIGAAFVVLYSVYLPQSMGGNDVFASLFDQLGDAGAAIAVVALAFVLPVGVIIGIMFTALIFHGAFRIFGAGRNGLGVSLKAICYAQGAAAVFNIVPVVGSFFALAWFFALTIIGAAKLHGTTYGRVAAAVLLLAAIIFCIGIAIGLAGGVSGVGSGAIAPPSGGKLI
jgi:hypothetical protein